MVFAYKTKRNDHPEECKLNTNVFNKMKGKKPISYLHFLVLKGN